MRNATHILTATMGAMMGLAGIEHGVGEILQGNTTPTGLVIQSWPGSEFFRIVGGEPAMTIVPNLIVTGILTILFSLAFLAWAILLIQKKNGGLILMLLSIAMMLVGAGFGPPVIGFILGAAATRINMPSLGRRSHLPAGFHYFLGKIWPGLMIACTITWLAVFPGFSILANFLGVEIPGLVAPLIFLAIGLLLATIFSGFAFDDIENGPAQTEVG